MKRKIAIVHDQLQEFGGAERVLVALKQIFPHADVYTSAYSPKKLGVHAHHFKDWEITCSWTDRVGIIKEYYSAFRFFTPLIWESFDLSTYDVVISSSGWFMCKGVITRPETLHVCYLHHPPRYLYYYETARPWQKNWLIRIYGHLVNAFLRQWDYLSSQRPDYFVANSQETQRRITKYYRRESDIIYCPVHIPSQEKVTLNTLGEFYITVSRLTRAKHIDLLIEVANKYKLPLMIVGSGRDAQRLKDMAGHTIQFEERVTDKRLANLYSRAKAFMFASLDEEFGIAPVEAMGHGVPVIAYASGGLKETVQHKKNGLLYDTLTVESLYKQIRVFESLSTKQRANMRQAARSGAERYSFDTFEKQILTYIESKVV